jgi:subtilisin family serine protease
MRNRRILATITTSAVIAAILVAPSIAAGNPKNDCVAVDGDYIVVLNKGVSLANDIKNVNGKEVKPKFMYDEVFNGYAAFLTADQVCHLQKRPTVAVVELDGLVSIDTTTVSISNPGLWGLDRIDQQTGTDNSYTYTSSGTGVDAYVVDSGLLSTHEQFAGRVKAGYSAVGKSTDTKDCNGHGTHVAGTIGGKNYGVAPGVMLVPVKVFGCSGKGTTSGVIAGLNWIVKNHTSNKAVANMSLGGGASSTLDTAVNKVISDGVTVVVAAGNDAANACLSSPARVPNAITVAAVAKGDTLATYSNFGSCVDIAAPGSGIFSSYIGSNSATASLSGTSMASPHVAGAVARQSQAGSLDLGQLKGSTEISGFKLLYIDPSK